MNAHPLLRAAFGLFMAGSWMMLQASCARSVSSDLTGEPTLFAPDAGGVSALNQCVETQCPPPWATCPGESGLCTINTSRDVRHCGSCGTPCPKLPLDQHATALCAGGKCAFACDDLFADCNHLPADGCETSTEKDPKNCGFCGNACKAGDLCWRGACGCPNGYTACGDECKKLDSDNDNCGSCGQMCRAPTSPADPAWSCGPGVTPPHTDWACGSSACTLSCKAGFGDCNKLFCNDGCEVDLLNDPANCGTCGRKCDANQACVDGACICPPGTTRCGDACVDVQVDAKNCGGCGNRCPGPASTKPGKTGHGSPGCQAGQCTYVCFPGYGDCDGDVFNGCEADLGSDPQHCGSCPTHCNTGAGQPCVVGKCLTRECDAGPLQ